MADPEQIPQEHQGLSHIQKVVTSAKNEIETNPENDEKLTERITALLSIPTIDLSKIENPKIYTEAFLAGDVDALASLINNLDTNINPLGQTIKGLVTSALKNKDAAVFEEIIEKMNVQNLGIENMVALLPENQIVNIFYKPQNDENQQNIVGIMHFLGSAIPMKVDFLLDISNKMIEKGVIAFTGLTNAIATDQGIAFTEILAFLLGLNAQMIIITTEVAQKLKDPTQSNNQRFKVLFQKLFSKDLEKQLKVKGSFKSLNSSNIIVDSNGNILFSNDFYSDQQILDIAFEDLMREIYRNNFFNPTAIFKGNFLELGFVIFNLPQEA